MTLSTQSASLADVSSLLADRTRASFCLALLDGRAWTANELASHANVARSTASEHLSRLVAGGLLVERRQGRHRYVQLADHRVAELLEGMGAIVGPVPEPVRTLRAARTSAALVHARLCYDHLAGRLGVAIAAAMTRSGLLNRTNGFVLTDDGMDWLVTAVGVEPAALTATRRPLVRECLDWTERQSHLAGAVGAQLSQCFLQHHWMHRVGDSRAVRLTPTGEEALRGLLDLDPSSLD